MEVNIIKEKIVDDPESLTRERFFVTTEHPDVILEQSSGKPKSSSRPSPDDPVPADKYTSYKLDEPVRLQMSDKGALAQKPLMVMTALQMAADRFHDNDAFADALPSANPNEGLSTAEATTPMTDEGTWTEAPTAEGEEEEEKEVTVLPSVDGERTEEWTDETVQTETVDDAKTDEWTEKTVEPEEKEEEQSKKPEEGEEKESEEDTTTEESVVSNEEHTDREDPTWRKEVPTEEEEGASQSVNVTTDDRGRGVDRPTTTFGRNDEEEEVSGEEVSGTGSRSSVDPTAFPGAMSKKRTSAESTFDEQTIECSDSVFQQEDNAKRAKLASQSDTTLQDLPIELLEIIFMKVVTMEVKDAKLVKSVLTEKVAFVVARLQAVCAQWSSILATDFFRLKVQRILDETAQKTTRLKILNQWRIADFALFVTSMKDEFYVLWKQNKRDHAISVYDRNNMEEVKDVIPLPGSNPLNIKGCNISNCVYVLEQAKQCILCITRDYDRQFNISVCIKIERLPNPTLSVTANGNLIISTQEGKRPALCFFYNASCILQPHGRGEGFLKISPMISDISYITLKSNGNLIILSRSNSLLSEIDTSGIIVREYRLSDSGRQLDVCTADIYGVMLLTERWASRIWLLDSEFNLIHVPCPHLEERYRPVAPIIWEFDRDRNEIITFFDVTLDNRDLLTILGFTDEENISDYDFRIF